MRRPPMCSCRCAIPVSNVTIYRYMRLIGPIAAELDSEDCVWVPTLTPNIFGSGLYTHDLWWNATDPWVSIDPVSGKKTWEYRPNGVRVEISGHHDVHSSRLQQRFFTTNLPVTGLSSQLPGVDSHVGIAIENAKFSTAVFSSWNAADPSDGDTTIVVTHYRVWVDGFDVTGVVALVSPYGGAAAIEPLRLRKVGGLMELENGIVLSAAAAGKTLWIDYWVTVRVFYRPALLVGTPDDPQVSCNLEYYSNFNSSELYFGNANRRTPLSARYQFAFSGDGPESLSELTPDSPGWTLTRELSRQIQGKTGVGNIILDWRTESPTIDLRIDNQLNVPFPPAGAVMRYMPSGTTYRLKLSNGSTVDTGVWNPTSPTVFYAVARLHNGTLIPRPSGVLPDSYFAGFPATITVSRP